MSSSPLQRALAVAPDRAVAGRTRPEQEFFCFRVANLHLGVPSENVREVTRPGPLTPLPRMPAFLLGVCGHRGDVLPVLDLLRLLNQGEGRIGPRTRIFIGVSGSYLIAVAADQVLGLRKVALADILPAPLGGDASADFLVGVVKLEGAESLSLLHFNKLLQSARQRAVSR